jgi:2-polyprenyl-3-methyl-5-hydroxy-6-metoxy-1,4-benzoquinol methylase
MVPLRLASGADVNSDGARGDRASMEGEMNAFEAYGSLARSGRSNLAKAGRYEFQQDAQKLILCDLEAKLRPLPQHSLLEIGCGPGNLLIPLSFRVRTAVGIDHPDLIEAAKSRCESENMRFLAGRFPETAIDDKFDRILIYSVLQCVTDFAEAARFLDAAAALLAPGGRMVVGDLPNADRKSRFQNSEAGQKFEVEWAQLREANPESGPNPLSGVSSLGTFNDQMIVDLIHRHRAAGFHAYVVDQDPALPFGHTREDIIIVRP